MNPKTTPDSLFHNLNFCSPYLYSILPYYLVLVPDSFSLLQIRDVHTKEKNFAVYGIYVSCL